MRNPVLVSCVFATLAFVLALLTMTTAFEFPAIPLSGRSNIAATTSRNADQHPTPSICHRLVVSKRCSIGLVQMRAGADDAFKEEERRRERRAANLQKKLDQEKERADRMAAELTLMREQMTFEKERADRKTAEAASAEAKAASAEAKAASANEKVTLMTGQRWVCFSDLVKNVTEISSSRSLSLDNGFPHPYLESLRPKMGDTMLPFGKNSNQLVRSAVGSFFATDVFGTEKAKQHEMAHCVPHSRHLSEIWHPVFESMLGKSISYMNSSKEVRLVVEGYSKNNHDRYPYSGFTHQPYNYMAMCLQGTFFDSKSSVAFCPVLTCEEMASKDVWEEGYWALCIASDAKVFKAIGAVDGEILECTADDPRVEKALKGFRDMSAILINLARSQLAISTDKNDLKLAKALRDFFRLKTEFVAPFPALNPQAKYRLVRFSKAVAIQPGTTVSAGIQAVGHPAPMPIPLVAKSLNSWLSYLLQADSKLQGTFRGLTLPKGYTGSVGEGYCSLFPMCDLDQAQSCCTCLANLVMMMHPIFDELNFDEQSRASVRRVAELQEFVPDIAAHSVLRKAARILAKAIDSKASLALFVARTKPR